MAPAAAVQQDRGYGESSDLECPFGELRCQLTEDDLRETAYEIFIAACRPSAGRSTLTYTPQSEKEKERLERSSSVSPTLQKSLTSAAASKMKKALGLRSSSKKSPSPSRSRKPQTIGELMRFQMNVSEQTDARVRRALLRISAGQLGKRVESIVLPLELLQQFRFSDFLDAQEYQAWQKRNLRIVEAGLLLHPAVPLERSYSAAQQLRQIIRGADEKPIETGKNSEAMQSLRSAVMSLALRAPDGSTSETCHWADGFPLNLRLYQMLLGACFDSVEETAVIDEVDEVMELMKKTWTLLGINQTLHNICFTWVLFKQFVATGQVEIELLGAAENQLVEVAKDAKSEKDPLYVKVLSSTLSTIQGWAEKRLLAYHDTFQASSIRLMESILSVALPAAKILVDDISHEYRRKRKEEVDVARNRIDMYIRSSLRTAFAQMMEQVDSRRRQFKKQQNPPPALVILANDIGDLARKEKECFSPVLKRWHPFSAGVAVATLHACYGRELKQFLSGLNALTPESVQVLQAADKLEKDLVQIAVEDSADCEDGGKGIIREMPPFEADTVMADLSRTWIKERLDRLREWMDRNIQQEVWSSTANKEHYAPSAVEVLRIVDETLDAFFDLPVSQHPGLLPDLVAGLDRTLQRYVSQVKSGCGTKKSYLPLLPALTRCSTGSKFGVWKKKDKSPSIQKRQSHVGSMNDSESLELTQLCVRINTLHHIRTELEQLEKRISYGWKTDFSNKSNETLKVASLNTGSVPEAKFELSHNGCKEGIQSLCESAAYKVVFHDLSSVLWDGLYVGGTAGARMGPFLEQLESNLEVIANIVHTRVRTRVLTALMKACFDGFLLVLLGGGPSRAFSKSDSEIIEQDFVALKDLFKADGDGLPEDLVEKAAMTVTDVLPLFSTDTDQLIENFRYAVCKANGISSAKSKLPLPPTSGLWSPTEPNTLLRVLCHRNDEGATKFLKKTYNLPKRL
uniref:TSA: Wollemia nobilis Ref_Wollemi_Transcript_18614_3809 transcribed RNA sequence n=1 Tax=Wollemia nobilis TaxID=56998 RepID=A0A0C9S5S1_9CONI